MQKVTNQNRFLETITTLGDEVIIPINRIKKILVIAPSNEGFQITIITDDDEYYECFPFGQDEKLNKRYEQIKKIIGAK